MSLQVIELGEVEPITVYTVDVKGDPLTGLTDLFVRLRRSSDGQYLDWDDMTFKAMGWVELDTALSEVDDTLAPGVYALTGDFDSGAVTNLAANDNLLFIITQTPGTNAKLPAPTELQVRPGAGSLSPGTIANAVWESLQSAHMTPGTMGYNMAVMLSAHVLLETQALAGSDSLCVFTTATQPDGFYADTELLVVNSAGSATRTVLAYTQTNGAFTLDSALPFTPDPNDLVIVLAGNEAVAGIKQQVDKIDLIPTLGLGAVTTGSLMDRICNKDSSKTYNQATDSLEAIRDRSG